MTAHTKGSGTGWVGRSIRRFEDHALVAGDGRFTADLATLKPMLHKFNYVPVGRPILADGVGQVHGGGAQGIGNALLEEIIYDESGNILTGTLADFLPPTVRECHQRRTVAVRRLDR